MNGIKQMLWTAAQRAALVKGKGMFGKGMRQFLIPLPFIPLTLLLSLVLSGCGRCHVIERYDETYARGKFVRCPEGVWVYNHDLISGERQRYFLTNRELEQGATIDFFRRSNLSVLQINTNQPNKRK